MNLFIIPSWYPSHTEPLGGIFTQEQAEAIADVCPDINVIVSTWGQHDGLIPLRRPWLLWKVLIWRMGQKRNTVTRRNGVFEIFNPALSWSQRIPFGGSARLIGANRFNLKLAIETFGNIDLIHAHVSYPAGHVASILGNEFGIPYVLTEHMSPFPFPSLMQGDRPLKEITQAFNRAAVSIAVSPSLGKQIASFGYRAPMVVPNVVDERRFITGKPTSNTFIFFTLCGLTQQKGIDHLLEAIAMWMPPSDQFEFRIGGDGPMRAAYQAMAARLGVADRISWLGEISREEAPRLFRECHVYVMPSRHETFGVVYAEAIASGKPVIATRCGGPEFIVNEENGILVDVGDVKELCRAMQVISTNWSSYDSKLIRAGFEPRFSRQAVVRQLQALYKEVLEN